MYENQSAVVTIVEALLAKRKMLTSWFVVLKNKFLITNNITITIDAITSVFEKDINKAVVCFLKNLHVSPGPLDSQKHTKHNNQTLYKLLMSKRIHEHNTWSCSKNSWLDVFWVDCFCMYTYLATVFYRQ